MATAGNGSSESKASRATQGSPSQAAASGSTHVVRSGETLWRISQQYGVTVAELQAANGLGSSTTVKAGQRLKIPGGAASGSPDTGAATAAVAGERTVHVVRRGETLSAIARRFNTSVEQLCRLNSLAPNAILMPGDTLTVR